MHGQGTLRWASGERYDGEWVEGEEHGLGVFTWRDGTTYDGFWQFGKKHGIGVRHWTVCCMSQHTVSDSTLADILPCATSMHTAVVHPGMVLAVDACVSDCCQVDSHAI